MKTFEAMPILENEPHELFAQRLAEGKTATEAYQLAGFRPSRKNASRLRAKEDIAARVFEIQGAGAKSAEISVASLLAELEDARAKATTLGQLSAAVRATSEKAKISGLLVERQQVEITHTDPYDEAETTTEVIAKMLEDFGYEPTKAIVEAFGLQVMEDGEILDIKRSTPRSVGNLRDMMGNAGNAGTAGKARPVLE